MSVGGLDAGLNLMIDEFEFDDKYLDNWWPLNQCNDGIFDMATNGVLDRLPDEYTGFLDLFLYPLTVRKQIYSYDKYARSPPIG